MHIYKKDKLEYVSSAMIINLFNTDKLLDNTDSYKNLFNLGVYNHKINKNYILAADSYNKAVDSGDYNALAYLGLLYYDIEKESKSKNYKKTLEYYNKAIKQNNNTLALTFLGVYYENIEHDYQQAILYYRLAIDNGYYIALTYLGDYYELIEHDNVNAVKYYLESIEKSNDFYAMNSLAVYYESVKDYDQAKKYYLMAVEYSDSDAMYNLGNYYKEIEHNIPKALEYYIMAHNNNDSDALDIIKEIATPLERYLICKEYNLPYVEKNATLKNDIYIYENKLKYASQIMKCPICLMDDKQCLMLRCFAHHVCNECYSKVYLSSCPLCRI